MTNRGYDYKKGKWTEARAKARFRGSDTVGALEVSFFGPFYAAYNVIALDPEYRYALVAGDSTKYLWILSRTTDIPDDVKAEYLAIVITSYSIHYTKLYEPNRIINRYRPRRGINASESGGIQRAAGGMAPAALGDRRLDQRLACSTQTISDRS